MHTKRQTNNRSRTFLRSLKVKVSFKVKCNDIGEGKAIPVRDGTGPEGSRKLRFSHFKTDGT